MLLQYKNYYGCFWSFFFSLEPMRSLLLSPFTGEIKLGMSFLYLWHQYWCPSISVGIFQDYLIFISVSQRHSRVESNNYYKLANEQICMHANFGEVCSPKEMFDGLTCTVTLIGWPFLYSQKQPSADERGVAKYRHFLEKKPQYLMNTLCLS